MAMYPAADVPVVQLSMPSLDPNALVGLGARLQSLRREGVLVMGSGFMTHSFEVFRNPGLSGHLKDFDEWAVDAIGRGDVDALTDYRLKGPSAGIAHPTADHFVPLLLALGASTSHGRERGAGIDRFFVGNSARSLQIA